MNWLILYLSRDPMRDGWKIRTLSINWHHEWRRVSSKSHEWCQLIRGDRIFHPSRIKGPEIDILAFADLLQDCGLHIFKKKYFKSFLISRQSASRRHKKYRKSRFAFCLGYFEHWNCGQCVLEDTDRTDGVAAPFWRRNHGTSNHTWSWRDCSTERPSTKFNVRYNSELRWKVSTVDKQAAPKKWVGGFLKLVPFAICRKRSRVTTSDRCPSTVDSTWIWH